MSRFSRLIDQLDDLDQQDIHHTSRLLGITATLYERLQAIVKNTPESQPHPLPEGQTVTKALLIQKFGNFHAAYAAYQKAYGVKCRGWESLLGKVQNVPIPIPLEDRVAKLEETVQVLSEVLLSSLYPSSKV